MAVWGATAEAVGYVSKRLVEGLERAGTSAPFFDVLVRLAREPSQRLAMTELATQVAVSSGGFTKLADRMEQEGLLYRQHSAQDRRVIYAVLTDAGRAAAAKMLPRYVDDLEYFVADALGVEDTANLRRIAARLRDHALQSDELTREVAELRSSLSGRKSGEAKKTSKPLKAP